MKMPHEPKAWLPFMLMPSAHFDRPEPAIVSFRLLEGETDWAAALNGGRLQPVGEWPVVLVLNLFQQQALHWHQRSTIKSKDAPSIAALRGWIAETRSLADRIPFEGIAPEVMRGAAAKLERVLDFRGRFFTRWPPSLGTLEDYRWRASLNLWAMDRLVRAVNCVEADTQTGARIPLAKFWPAMFEAVDEETATPAFADVKEADKRIASMDATVKTGVHDDLMRSLLAEVLTIVAQPPDAPPK